MADRNLTTTRSQVFGDVKKGTKCRVCGRNVEDGRSKVCSDYCGNLLSAVMGMLNWSSVRRKIIDRDNETCQECGFDMAKERLARHHIRHIIKEKTGDPPDHPGMSDLEEIDQYDWDDHHERWEDREERRKKLKQRYGDPYENSRTLEVDHIKPVSEGGHPFDPANLQTLCSECHKEKTAQENSERTQTPSRGELSESLFEYVTDGV